MVPSEPNGVLVAGIEQADADANIQRAISRLHPFLVKLIHSNPITSKKMGNYKPDFNESLQAIIEDWSLFYSPGSTFSAFQKYFFRAIRVRNFVAHQSFDCNRYQHSMESLANVATAIGEPDLAESIRKVVAIKDGNNTVNVVNVKEDDWESLKQEGTQHYLHKRWEEAMNCYTRAIHLNQGEAGLYSNRALCELRLSKFDLAREDIEDAIQLEPENIKFYRILSKILLKLKMYQESLDACMQGLAIDPRDEVLNVRERDCRALMVPVLTDVPVLGKSISILGRDIRFAVLPNPNILPITSEDIENCDYDKFCECSSLSESLEKACQFELAGTQDSEREALKIYIDAARRGVAYGLFNIAKFYCEGKAGLTRDFHKAIKYSRKAASQKAFIRNQENIRNDCNVLPNVGVADAENFLGDCYRDGRGVEQCRTEAFKWYLKAARHNSLTGQNNLGLALLNGDGCKVDETSARSWFQRAADYGHAEAQYNYAIMLEEGLGGPVDVKKAGEMLQLAADQDHAEALKRLHKLSRSGALGASYMDKTQEKLCKKAMKGDPVSYYLVGLNFLNGTGGFVKDVHKAELLLRTASDCGYADAHLPLGKLLLDLKKNEEAFEFIKLSAEKGSAEGQLQLGLLYNYGHGCARDEAQARRWFNRAQMQGVTFKLHPDGKLRGHDDEWVEEMIALGSQQCEFETQNQLDHEGLLLEDRIRRFEKSQLDLNDPDELRYFEYLNVAFPPGGRRPRVPPYQSEVGKGITPEVVNKLKPLAENGSITAQSIINSLKILECARDLLRQKRTNEAFKLFRLSMRKCELLHSEFTHFYGKCFRTAKKALDDNPQDADALYVLTKFCLINDGIDTSWKAWDPNNQHASDAPTFLARNGLVRSKEERLQMAKRCVELDSSVPDYHHLLAEMCRLIQDHKNGLRAIERAIELLPSQTGWLYDRANFILTLLLGGNKDYITNDAVEPYLKFLSSNPADHQRVPEAYYHLAYFYAIFDKFTKAKEYFQKGLEAEDPSNPDRLPCFYPVDDEFFVKKISKAKLKARIPLEETDCANCLKSNQTLWCIVCKKVRYCNRVCQLAHRKEHKADCKRMNRSKK